MHHPEIMNLNKEIAARVEVHIGKSAEVMNLAQSICQQGPAYEYDPKYQDGWCVLVPLKNADGTLKKDDRGKQVYDYQFSAKTQEDMKPAIKNILYRVKNDPELKDRMYAVRQRGATEETTVVEKLAARYQFWNSNGVQLAATQTGYKHNVWFKTPTYTGSGATRSFRVDIVNMNFIWYGVYVQYLDAAGQAISTSESGAMLSADIVKDALAFLGWFETDTVKWVNFISSPPTVFGVPVLPYPTEVNITMPEGANSVRIMLCGPGANGKVDYGPSLVAGIIMTMLFQYALPVYFLVKGSGIDEDKSLWDNFKKKDVIIKTIITVIQAIREGIHPSSCQEAALLGSVESLMAALLQTAVALITNGGLPKITEWVVQKKLTQDAKHAIPFVGWVMRIVTLTGTVADVTTATTEIATNPLVIANTITLTASVEVTVHCDPDNYQFPEESTYYEVQFTVTGATFPPDPKGFSLVQSVRGQRSFKVTLDGVPTTGKTDDTVRIWFFSDTKKGWLAGEGKAKFTNSPTADGSVKADVTITQNQIPLTATTAYSQHRKLEYLGGRYVWNEDPATLAAPVIEPANCGTGLCELTNISIWVPGGMLGYSWSSGGRHIVKNVNAQEADPNPGMKRFDGPAGAPTPVAYDKTAPYTPANMTGNHFYLDPVRISADNPAYYLRKLNLDPASGLFRATESWGRFPMQLDRLAVHPWGCVVGISTNNHKLGILDIPDQAYSDDANTNNAVLKLGYGENDKFVKKPQALTISRTGAILILEGEGAMSIKAFDVFGNPWPFFADGTRSSFPLQEEDAKWLDIGIDDTEFVYILSYTGTGTRKDDYRLDVYNKAGQRVFRNIGISVARMIVDKWRRIYSLNQEIMKNSPILEPTVSVWMPSVPR